MNNGRHPMVNRKPPTLACERILYHLTDIVETIKMNSNIEILHWS